MRTAAPYTVAHRTLDATSVAAVAAALMRLYKKGRDMKVRFTVQLTMEGSSHCSLRYHVIASIRFFVRMIFKQYNEALNSIPFALIYENGFSVAIIAMYPKPFSF